MDFVEHRRLDPGVKKESPVVVRDCLHLDAMAGAVGALRGVVLHPALAHGAFQPRLEGPGLRELPATEGSLARPKLLVVNDIELDAEVLPGPPPAG